ncbi:hypothetical protein QQ020_14980 [Fulvivirgaceae bacterium BMA12]|uniref:Lipoprotein n=1 Tax=Agaribacillus aureus TaxID=3051825 RepID=A0ABT8L6J6_9BACT|nr:hypothetical protein [Fulvivirgaceae bacterium BMA12]
MKYLFKSALFVIILFASISCSEDEVPDPVDEATVIGQDLSLCMCCGGWFIDIDGERLRFDEVPAGNIDLSKETLPLKVRVKWQQDPDQCFGNEILIQKMEKL